MNNYNNLSPADKHRKDMIISELIKDPRFDDEWVDAASTIILKKSLDNNFTDEVINMLDYNSSQLQVIANAISNNIEGYEKVLNPQYNSTQMSLLLTAIDQQIPEEIVSKIYDPKIPYTTMNYIIEAYSKVQEDITDFALDRNYDPDQIFELYSGVLWGLDYKKYMNPEIDAETMGLCRHALSLGMDFRYDSENKILTIK